MTLKDYISFLKQPESLTSEQVQGIKSIVNLYPYFQSARALYLKGLKNQDSFKYNHELKITAAYTMDRTLLFDFITSDNFTKKNNIHPETRKKLPVKNQNTIVEESLEIEKPIDFGKNEKYSFNEWLQLLVKKPIIRNRSEQSTTAISKEAIIDRFIKNNPTISRPKNKSEIHVRISENKEDSSLMTETLARVYLEQKKYENAMKAYRILSLKYPEKSGFFADQIKKIKTLQKNTS
ncbi:MAG: hypothetical protein GKR88_18610 [Flavobacteriaceae bacterium]|nr:MAG: hypothetical protein GKR88_18610 [Flavobacteriaceae bacterium]